MGLVISFLAVCALFWEIFVELINFPKRVAIPWPQGHRLGLENIESLVYWLCLLCIPLLSAGFSWVLDKIRGRRIQADSPPSAPLQITNGSTFWRKVQNIIFWVVIPFIIFLAHPRAEGLHLNRPLEFLDAGIRLSATNQYHQGKRPYHEIFLDYGPFLEIIQPRLAFNLFGETLEAHRRLDWFIDPLGPVAIYFLSLIFMRNKVFVLLFTLILFGRFDMWIPARAVPPLSSLFFIGLALNSKNLKERLLMTGAGGFLAGISFFYSMEGGLLLGAAMAIYYFLKFLEEKWLRVERSSVVSEVACFGLGGLTVILGVALWLGRIDSFVEIPRNTAKIIYVLKDLYGKPTPALVKPLAEMIKNPFIIFSDPNGVNLRWWFPPFFSMIVLSFYWHSLFNKRKFPTGLLLLTLTGTLFFSIALGRSDYEHWLKGTPTFWLSVVVAMDLLWISIRIQRPRFHFSYWSNVIGFLFLLSYSLSLFRPSLISDTFRNWTGPHPTFLGVPEAGLERVGGLDLRDEDKKFVKNIVLRLRKYAGGPGGSAYLFNDFALFYFLADVINPTRYSVASWIGEEMNDEVVRDLKDKKPSCVMAVRENNDLFHTIANKNVSDYISANYREVDHWENFVFLQRKK